MTKSERKWLKLLTVLVIVLLITSFLPLAYIFGDKIYNSIEKSRRDEVERNVFSDCAYVAQAHMNCYDDERRIVDYRKLVNWQDSFIGYCFFFDKGGYALVTSYDYAIQKFSLDEDTPFPEDIVPEELQPEAVQFVYSLQPTTFVLPDDGDENTPRQYRTLEAGGCFCMDVSQRQIYCFGYPVISPDEGCFSGNYLVYPGAGSSFTGDAKYFAKLVEPDKEFRERMLKVAEKQLIETGHNDEEYINELYRSMEELADSKKDSGMLRYILGS